MKLEQWDGEKWVDVTPIGHPQRNRVNVGIIAHVEFGKSTLQRAIRSGINSNRGNKSDRKRNRKDRWR